MKKMILFCKEFYQLLFNMNCVGEKMVQNCYAKLYNSQTDQEICNNRENLFNPDS